MEKGAFGVFLVCFRRIANSRDPNLTHSDTHIDTPKEILSFKARALKICIHANWTIIRLFCQIAKKNYHPPWC